MLFCLQFNGKQYTSGEHTFDLTDYDLPESWFKTKKPRTCLRCKDLECIYSLDVKERLGNILKSYPKLWSEICRAFHNCTISEKFENVCDCEYEIIEKEINLGLTTESDCGCET
ncbi:hypothetical protein [Flavobacterium sp. AED]|uniref:hypothetical protein n=1 Tax=Flavobacterium sp. AED TaxID=1423323 RepID=UPI00057F158E|nr:hypothetical protein [Flavobacterium sp. AED]KIA82423.1 hypothetical protein OA85_16275 [Flavobacterium sp. AED]